MDFKVGDRVTIEMSNEYAYNDLRYQNGAVAIIDAISADTQSGVVHITDIQYKNKIEGLYYPSSLYIHERFLKHCNPEFSSDEWNNLMGGI